MSAFSLVLNLTAIISSGIAIGMHFGAGDGITAAIVIYALIPWPPRSA